MNSRGNPRSHSAYTVGWICALDTELNAARAALDQEHPRLPKAQTDTNIYVLGSIFVETGSHNVVIACLPSGQYGTNSAAIAATQMTRTFQNLKFGLLVGIGGGVPNITDDPLTCSDIRLGDVVVGVPTPGRPAVLQYDLGKLPQGERWPSVSGTLNKPPRILLNAIPMLRSNHLFGRRYLSTQVVAMLQRFPSLASNYAYQGAENDILFQPSYAHVGTSTTCQNCATSNCQTRPVRENYDPQVFYGTIASGNQVVKDSVTRDYWRDREKILCFEMEAAGLVDEFDCLVIRGICDYADSHKNKRWQPYAAITAAAYAKNLLLEVAPDPVVTSSSINHGIAKIKEADTDYALGLTSVNSPTFHIAQNTRRVEPFEESNIYNLEELQRSFWFRGIDDRFESVEESYKGTFRWLFRYDENRSNILSEEFNVLQGHPWAQPASLEQRYSHWFQAEVWKGAKLEWDPWGLIKWLREGDGIFFISGKLGSGKSTFMKCLFEDPTYLSLLREWAGENTLISPSFFFWRAGLGLQKSQVGLLQSLMYQLCKTTPELISKLIEPAEALDAIKRQTNQPANETCSWNIYELRRFLKRLVSIDDLKLCWLIDGLDEFEGDPTFISQFLYELSRHSHVKILVAGRPFVEYTTTFKAYTCIKLHEWTQRDIETYTKEVLFSYDTVREMASTSHGEFERLVLDLINGAEGVFIWVKTAITSLLDGINRGDSIRELRIELEKLPQDLYELYDSMLRSLDARYLGQTKLFLGLIHNRIKKSGAAHVDEIAFANDYDDKNLNWLTQWFTAPKEEREHFVQRIKRRVLKTCANFIILTSRNGESFAFVHKSVLDFFETPKMQIWLYGVHLASKDFKIRCSLGNFIRHTVMLVVDPDKGSHHIAHLPSFLISTFVHFPAYDGSDLTRQTYRQLELLLIGCYNRNTKLPFFQLHQIYQYSSRRSYLQGFLQAYVHSSWNKYWPSHSNLAFCHLLVATQKYEACSWKWSLMEESIDTESRTRLLVLVFVSNSLWGYYGSLSHIEDLFDTILNGDEVALRATWQRFLQLFFWFLDCAPDERYPVHLFRVHDFYHNWVGKFIERGVDYNACVAVTTVKTGNSISPSVLNILYRSASDLRTYVEQDSRIKEMGEFASCQKSLARSVHLVEQYGARDFIVHEVDEAQLDWELPQFWNSCMASGPRRVKIYHTSLYDDNHGESNMEDTALESNLAFS